MKNLLQLMGALSRDMLFMHGHITSLQGLDTVTPPIFRRADGKQSAVARTAAARKPVVPDKACCC